MKATSYWLGAALTLATGLGAAQAQAQTISNGGFEGGPGRFDNQSVGVGSTAIPGWTIVNGSNSTTGGGKEIAWLGDGAYGFNTPFGTDYLDLTGYSGSTGDSGVSQTIATVVGGAYTLSFYLGGMQGYGPISANVYAGSQFATISDPITNGIAAGSTLWTQQTFSFVATSINTTVSIIGNNSGQDFIGLDNVSISGEVVSPGAVPEPASWAMMIMGFGMISVGLRHRQRGTKLRYS